MTENEKRLIQSCRVMIVGTEKFVSEVRRELLGLGFRGMFIDSASVSFPEKAEADMIIRFVGSGENESGRYMDVPSIYAFDFINGAGVFVLFPKDDKEFLCSPDVRLWSAEYMVRYCMFWNIDGVDWLWESLPLIRKYRTNDQALKTAAYVSSRIVANIAVGRDLKHYPRFYL
ncbi:MAG: hypothetical protein K2H49_07455, partial [Muribaculaceae bacterium]|nr:hypothetical protein [Muribaculaceae bacterium]